MIDQLRRGMRSAAAPLLTVVLVAAFSFSYVPLAHGELRSQQTAMSLKARARALWGVGRSDDDD